MILDPEYATDPSHIKLLTYLSSDMSMLLDNHLIIEALQYYGKMDMDTISTFLASNTGPTIKIWKDHDPGPHFSDMDTLYLIEQEVRDFESDADIFITNYGKKVHSLGVGILETIVVVNNGHDFDLEKAFVKNLYGIDDSHPWRQRQADGRLTVYQYSL
jgi:hypothetical protein